MKFINDRKVFWSQQEMPEEFGVGRKAKIDSSSIVPKIAKTVDQVTLKDFKNKLHLNS